MDTSLIARLFIAHLLGDFALQPDSWVQHKRARHFGSPFLYLHALVHFALAWIACASAAGWKTAAIIAAGHIVLDGGKALLKGDGVRAFVADQLGHILILLACWMPLSRVGWNKAFVRWAASPEVLWPVCGYGAAIFLFPKLVALATRQWRSSLDEGREPLIRAGRWIGIIERVLVLTFVLIDNFGAVGFLLAAKSVLRFGDLRDANDKGQTEYVLIGTLLSFGLTILTGLLVRELANF